MNIGFVNTHTALEEGGGKVDGDVLEFGVVIPIFVKEKCEFLAVSKGRDRHEASPTSSDDIGD